MSQPWTIRQSKVAAIEFLQPRGALVGQFPNSRRDSLYHVCHALLFQEAESDAGTAAAAAAAISSVPAAVTPAAAAAASSALLSLESGV